MTTIVLPPAYTPPPTVPSYSPKPTDGESTVSSTPRIGEHPTGTFITKKGGDALVLAEQEPNAERPVYGRAAVVSGFVSIENRDTVSEVVLKVKGKMEFMISEGGSSSQKLIDDTYTLWSLSSPLPSTSSCPGMLPFSVALPTKYYDDDHVARPLPPSYEVPFSTMPGMFFHSKYFLSVNITRARSRKLHFLSKTTTITTPFTYSPRSRPWRSMQPSFEFLSDVKTMPEEFKQVSWDVLPKPKTLKPPLPLEVHLFLPTVDIFGLDDAIPFHVQLAGSVDALAQFLPRATGAHRQGISACLVRQIVIEVNGRKAARTFNVATATLTSLPPTFSSDPSPHAPLASDFSGTVKPDKRFAPTGAFDVGAVRVQDFLVVELWPADLQTLHRYSTLKFSHPVRLVTDPYAEGSGHPSTLVGIGNELR
uniref:Arrestin-like N-terminal domain-containing protein n=1 Tax=Mycena chlorophos TaxID=658473 RepID=A0ABQ0LL10_MYCCL|nr:predicted protein [Mycena chlorophos]